MKLKQSRHLLTSCEPLLGRILNHVTLLNLIRILHNKGGKLYGTSLHFCYVEACRKSHNVESSAPSNRISCGYNVPKGNFRKDAEECLSFFHFSR